MKRDLFLLLVSILFILMLLYFYEQKEQFLNKKLQLNENTYIEYPYFHKKEIDQYIYQYLNFYIGEDNRSLFIDYDYNYLEDENLVHLLFYIYEENGVVIRENVKEFALDLEKDKVVKVFMAKPTTKTYDNFYQRLIQMNKPMIALTFDDGPNYNTNKVLDILEKYQVKATFFLLGCNIAHHEDIIQRMSNLNMEIGNHMYSHKLLTKLKKE